MYLMNLHYPILRTTKLLTGLWLKTTITGILWLLSFVPVVAQTVHPVTASLQLVPPYSVYLADYAAPGNDKLRVILTLNDLTQPSYTVRLQVKVELNGRVVMQTDPAYRPSGITLTAGLPQVITGSQLNEYLVTSHLQFMNGFSRDNYERTKALPEGAYRICVTAYDYYRNDQVPVSNEGCNIFFFQKKEAPVLNMPLCNTRVEQQDPQFLTFNWSMRNTPSPFVGAAGTGYRFELYEVRPAGSNPEYIVRSSKPIYTATTDAVMLVYGPGEPQLLDSMQYVWRVQAFDKDGRDAYQNNGYSPACVFTYGGGDPFLAHNVGKPDLFGESLGERSGKWWWSVANGKKVDGWNVQYRKQASAASKGEAFDWNKQYVSDTLLHLFNLEPDNVYEARVQATIKGITGSWSETTVFRTMPRRVYECGKNDTSAYGLGSPGSGQPLNSAVAGMVVRVGDFDMQLLQVSGGNGRFSGYGAVATPLLGFRVNVKFSDVQINDKLLLTQGEVVALSDGIDQWIKDTKEYFRGGDEVGDVVTGDIAPTFTTELPILTIDAIKYDSLAQTIVITDPQSGKSETLDVKGKTFPVTIEDNDGDLYQVDKDGKVKPLGKRDNGFASNNPPQSLNKLHPDKATVVFRPGQSNQYGFDAWKPAYGGKAVLENEYEKLDDGKYRVPVKAMAPGVAETVVASLTIKDASVKAEKIRFITGKGVAYAAERVGNTFTVSLTGGPAGDAQELYAVYPVDSTHYITLGKLLVVSYAPKKHKVVLIAVDKAAVNREAVTDKLNRIYQPLGISYEVVVDESFRNNKNWDANKNTVLDITPSGLFSNGATGEMKGLIDAYRAGRTLDKRTAYLFVLNESSKEGLLGEMPRGEQFGYVFVQGASDDAVGRTVAHELGHGRYKLEHAFDKNIGLTKGAADNLMDYSEASALVKYQWDAVHDPGVVWGALEGEGDGQDVMFRDVLSKAMLNEDTLYFSFLTPDARKICLPKKLLVQPMFAYSIEEPANYKLVAGTLLGFAYADSVTKELTRYRARITNNQFSGYFPDGGGPEYKPVEAKNATDESLIMLFPGSTSDFRLIKFTVPAGKLERYTAMAQKSVPVADERAVGKKIRLFTKETPAAREERIAATPGLVNGMYNDLSEGEIDIIKGVKKSPELLPLLKAAAWRKLQTSYYLEYTSGIQHKIFCSPSNGGPQCLIWEKQDFDRQDILNDLLDKDQYEFYCVFLDSIRNYCGRFEAKRTDVIAQLSAQSDWAEVMMAFYGLNDVEMMKLSLAQRVLLVKFALKKGISARYESLGTRHDANFEHIVVRLFKTTPEEQQPGFLDSLAAAKDFNNDHPHLLAGMSEDYDGLDGDEWKAFATLMTEWIFTHKPRTETFDVTNHINNKQVLIFDNNKGLYILDKMVSLSAMLLMVPPDAVSSSYSLSEEFTKEGAIKMSSYKGGLIWKVDNRTVTKNPYEYVFIYFKDDHIFESGMKISKGAILPVPAFMVYSLFNDVNTGRIIVGARTTVDVALLFVGVGEITAAIRAAETGTALLRSWRFYKSVADITIGSADIVINDVLGDKLEKDSTGRKILYYWNIASLTYSFSRLSYEGAAALKRYSKSMDEVVEEYQKRHNLAKDNDEYRRLEKLRKTLEELAQAIKKSRWVYDRLKRLGCDDLLLRFEELDELAQLRFLDDFQGASDMALQRMNEKLKLVDFWEANRDLFKGRDYAHAKHKPWSETGQEVAARNNPHEKELYDKLDGVQVTENDVAYAAATSPELKNPVVVLRKNDKTFEVTKLEDELQESIDYLNLIRDDMLEKGNLYQKLYTNISETKLKFAGRPGIHAEVLATNEIIKQLKFEGKFKSLADLKKINVMVKGFDRQANAFTNMCRCPHCFHILPDVNIFGNK